MSVADLVEALQRLPSQLLADLILGVPLTVFVVLVLLSAHARRGRRTWL